ncbi:(2Fe-2S)-binding protein, partial [Streptomyces sp. 150FB]|uniref:(2Fe-2S)-binding protein n=1 Tax=Streptomyces sp. 150FB TaxID=1576605 RepID=UPI000588F83C
QARPDTVICRCEETDYASVRRAAEDPAGTEARVAKLATRAGLGPCQGRVCGPTVAELRERPAGAATQPPDPHPSTTQPPDPQPGSHHRPVTEPITLGELAGPPEPERPGPSPRTP